MAPYTAGFMTHVTCRLTAKNRNQLRNPTLSSRVWAIFTFLQWFVELTQVGSAKTDEPIEMLLVCSIHGLPFYWHK